MPQINQFKILLLALFSAFFLAACNGEAKEETAVKDYLTAISTGQIDKAMGMLYLNTTDTAEKAAIEGKLKAMLIEMKESFFDSRGGLKKVEITSKVFSEDKKEVKIDYKTTLGNGDEEPGSMSLILLNGEWKIKIN